VWGLQFRVLGLALVGLDLGLRRGSRLIRCRKCTVSGFGLGVSGWLTDYRKNVWTRVGSFSLTGIENFTSQPRYQGSNTASSVLSGRVWGVKMRCSHLRAQ